MRADTEPRGADPATEQFRKRWRTVLIVGIVLGCGPVLGILGTVAGMMLSLHQIENLTTPTPGDLAQGVYLGWWATVIGVVAGVVGAVLICLSWLKLHRPRAVEGPRPWN